jgi:NAD(P)H-dependent FMN reductase
MMNILGVSGSLRRGSLNTRLLRVCVDLLPPGAELEIASLRDVPLYDGDVEAEGIPPAVTELKERVAAADALLLVSPEYNHSMPGVLKNAIDWMSRPAADIHRVFRGRPVALIGASPGGFGTARGQAAWLPVLRAVQLRPWFEAPPFYLSKADEAFDEQGALRDERTRGHLAAFLRGFVDFAAAGNR